MKVSIADRELDFRPWRPEDGRVYATAYAFDCETTRIDDVRPWITPAYVLGAAFDGQQGYFIPRDRAAAFFAAHEGVPIAMHHAPFDLAVLNVLAPTLDIYKWVDQNLIWDTQILHRLYLLGVEGNTASGKGQSTLEHCADYYLQISLPKDTMDSKGNPVRLSYGQWLNRSPAEIEPVYLEYLAKDAVATFGVVCQEMTLVQQLLAASGTTWGYVSPEWLRAQIDRWGHQTHHIQLKGAIVLSAITANGLTVDLDHRDELVAQLQTVAENHLVVLRQQGMLPGQPGSDKALQEILRRLDAQHPELHLPRTATGAYSKSQESLESLRGVEPFVDALLAYKAVEKLRGAFLDKMGKRVLHPSFDVLKTTGRTSSFGDINAQNLPRDDRVRSCFVPSEGHVFVAADYSTIELGTLAQSVLRQFGCDSSMAHAINSGQDLHRLVAARVAGKPENEVTEEERRKAKAINFGKPGGMGNNGLKAYAKASYGTDLSDVEVEALSDSWFDRFPEMKVFLSGEGDLREEVARLLCLTPSGYWEHTGSRSFLEHPANAGRENQPHPILGGMCLKVLKVPSPKTHDGRDYTPEELDFFWSKVNERLSILPSEFHAAIRARRPSPALQRAVMRFADRKGVFTVTGRLRANASYCARHNTVFQGLAADGAKLALWSLWRAGYRIVNFIHDEVLIEIPATGDLTEHAHEISQLMVRGMKAVVPDIAVKVKLAATDRWYKSAEAEYDERGRLLLSQPHHCA